MTREEAKEQLAALRAELRDGIALITIELEAGFLRDDDHTRRCRPDEHGRHRCLSMREDWEVWRTRMVYALQGEVPPWEQALEVRELMRLAGELPTEPRAAAEPTSQPRRWLRVAAALGVLGLWRRMWGGGWG